MSTIRESGWLNYHTEEAKFIFQEDLTLRDTLVMEKQKAKMGYLFSQTDHFIGDKLLNLRFRVMVALLRHQEWFMKESGKTEDPMEKVNKLFQIKTPTKVILLTV